MSKVVSTEDAVWATPPGDLSLYQLRDEKDVPNGYAGLNGAGKVPAARVDLAGYQGRDEKGVPSGYAGLGSDGIVPTAQLPPAVGGDLSAFQSRNEKGAAGGYASLDGNGLVPLGQLPAAATSQGQTLVSVKATGTVLGDGRLVNDAVMSSGNATLTSATAAFTLADEGKIVAVIGAGAAGATLGATISTYISPTQVTLSATASTAITGGTATFGHNDGAAINTILASMAAAGGTLYFPPGIYCTSVRIDVPGGVQIHGSGLDYANYGVSAGNLVGAAPARASVLRAAGSFNSSNSLIRFGSTQVTYTSGNVSPSAHYMMFDGAYLAQSGAQTWAARGFLTYCWIGQGNTYGLDMTGQNSRCFGCVTENGAKGVASLYLNANDIKFFGGEVRNGGQAQVWITNNCTNYRIEQNDIFGSTAAGAPVSDGIRIAVTSGDGGGGTINNNSIDATRGDMLKIVVSNGRTISRMSFCSNRCYGNGSYPGGTYGVVRLDMTAGSGTVKGLKVSDNVIHTNPGFGPWNFLLARSSGIGTTDQVVVEDNTIEDVGQLFASIVPTHQRNNIWSKSTGGSGITHNSTPVGQQTLSGDGTAVTFNIPHGMSESGGAAPVGAILTARSAAAAAPHYVSAFNDTNITVTFLTAPPAGSNNIVFNWEAWL